LERPGRADLPRRERHLLAASPDLRAEELVRAQRLVALLALDGGDRRERGTAGLAAPQQLAAALRALLRHLGLELLEPAPRRAAPKAHRDPVAEHLPALLAQPVGRLAHAVSLGVLRRCNRTRTHLDRNRGQHNGPADER